VIILYILVVINKARRRRGSDVLLTRSTALETDLLHCSPLLSAALVPGVRRCVWPSAAPSGDTRRHTRRHQERHQETPGETPGETSSRDYWSSPPRLDSL